MDIQYKDTQSWLLHAQSLREQSQELLYVDDPLHRRIGFHHDEDFHYINLKDLHSSSTLEMRSSQMATQDSRRKLIEEG